jgi:DNA-binding MarR family transcriptional regulator
MMHVFEDELAKALLDLTNRMNSPRQDEILLREAGVSIDRALFPLLARIGRHGFISVVELAEQVDRDPSTISRQVAKLEQMELVTRQPGRLDQRVREAAITPEGQRVLAQITTARRRLLKHLLADWSDEDRQNLPRLIGRLAQTMKDAVPL